MTSHTIKPKKNDLLRAAIVAALLCVGFVSFAAPANAHALVEKTTPSADQVVARSPRSVTMEFSEPVEIAFGAIRVYDTNGTRVDEGQADHLEGRPETVAAPLRGDLPDGTYTVTWRVISADGHPISEAFVFHVGSPGSRPQGIAAEVLGGEDDAGPVVGFAYGVVRWVLFGSLLLLAGAASFLIVAWLGWPGRQPEREPEVAVHFGGRFRRIVVWSWVAAVVATLLSTTFQTAVAGGIPLGDVLDPAVLDDVMATRFGKIALLRLALLAAAAVLWSVAQSQTVLGRDASRVPARSSVGAAALQARVPGWAVAIAGAVMSALLGTPGLQGHAGSTQPVALNLLADTLHMAGAAAWMGGLVLLWAAAWPATRALGEPSRTRVLAPVVARFSDMAVVAVGVLVVTGTYRAFVEIGALRGLTGTAYGITFLTKMAAFVPLLALGVVNNRWTKPRIVKTAEAGESDTGSLSKLRRSVGVETALAVIVVAITALLVNLPPAKVEAGLQGPLIEDVRLGDDNLNVVVDPNEIGENAIHLTATTPSGAPARIKGMEVLFRMPEQNIGPLVTKGKRLATGHYVVQGRQLSVPGEWKLEIVARPDRFTEERATVEVTVND